MRIDGSIGPEYLNLPKGEGKSSKSKASNSSKGADQTGGPERASAHQALIQEALAAEEVNLKAVEQARAMLDSGELDTPEAIKRAAENMLDLGF